LFFLLSGGTAYCQSVRATTEDGKQVILHPDGTWKYQKTRGKVQSRPLSSRKLVKSKRGTYGIWINENKWVKGQPTVDSHDLSFTHVNADILAVTIAQRRQNSLDFMQGEIVRNAEDEFFTGEKLIHKELRVINGKKVLYIRLAGNFKSVPITLSYYVYSGKIGTLQLMVSTGRDLYSQYKKDIVDLMNGLEILK
jgi:hypothetical protein